MNEIQNFSFICQTDKFISIKNRNDESKQDNNFFVFHYRCDSHATKDFTCFHWIIHDHVIHELYCQTNKAIRTFSYDLTHKTMSILIIQKLVFKSG
jgi:hypothetical protein